MNPSIEVYVATHKPIDFALPDYCKKIQVNAEANGQWPGYLHDNDSPDNISLKNPNYCELTVLYSMWMNCKADIQGLFHYRRFITGRNKSNYSHDWQIIITENEVRSEVITEQAIIHELEDADIILNTPIPYVNVNVQEAFRVHIHWKDLRKLYRIIDEKYPDYIDSFKYVMNRDGISQCNMFIARRSFVDSYCKWLFDILSEAESMISLDGYDSDHKRIYGYFAEFLLNVYVHKHNLRVKYFHRAPIFPISTVRRILRKIPVLMNAKRFMQKQFYAKTVVWRKLTGLNKFLASHPQAEKVKSYMRSLGDVKGNFLCLTCKYKEYGDMYIADLMPENENTDFIPALEELMLALKAEAAKEKCELIPRIILSSKTSESVKKSLFELGVRVLEY